LFIFFRRLRFQKYARIVVDIVVVKDLGVVRKTQEVAGKV